MAHDKIEIATDDGTCDAHVFTPSGEGPWPGVLFYMDGVGIRPALFEIGERLASAGYYVLLPNLFYRAGGEYVAPDPVKLFTDPEVRAHWTKTYFSTATAPNLMRDTRAFLAHLGERAPGKVGTTGYCLGGRMSFLAAATYPDRIAAAAAFHPGGLVTDAPDSPHLLATQIRAKVYVGGATDDAGFTAEQQAQLDRALAEAGVEHEVVTYAAKHGWVPSDTPVHDAAQTERHWTAMLDLFARTLGRGAAA
ncbi:MAG: dienelactone hydrolase family protein [Kofleriaceae bacterium]|nr:dienelactone hydrolase family protein [Kofleriaceae bacterium]